MSPLGPIDPSSVPEAETEKTAPWIVRKLVGVCVVCLVFLGRSDGPYGFLRLRPLCTNATYTSCLPRARMAAVSP